MDKTRKLIEEIEYNMKHRLERLKEGLETGEHYLIEEQLHGLLYDHETIQDQIQEQISYHHDKD